MVTSGIEAGAAERVLFKAVFNPGQRGSVGSLAGNVYFFPTHIEPEDNKNIVTGGVSG